MAPRVISKTSYFDFNREPLYGDQRMKFIILRSFSSIEGLKFMKTLLKSLFKNETKVALLCLDGPIECLTNVVDVNNKALVFDEFTNRTQFNDTIILDDHCMDKLNKFEGFLCIYSLTSLIIQKGVNSIYKTLQKLLFDNPKIQILSLMYPDSHVSSDIEILDNLATSVVEIDTKDCESKFLMTTSTRNKSFGQVWYEYQISPEFTFLKISTIALKCSKMQTKKPDPTANLTFNLNLNDDEKEARSQLQMPFAKSQTTEGLTIQDVEDDLFEEEDPDDDLGFLDAI